MARDCVCVDDPRDHCGAHVEGDRGGWYCTREQGHEGDHVACSFSGLEHRIVEWSSGDAVRAVA